MIGPRRLRPGWISASGLSVSTVVEIIAMNQPLADTWQVRVAFISYCALCDLVGVGHHRYVDVALPSNLLLRDDNLR